MGSHQQNTRYDTTRVSLFRMDTLRAAEELSYSNSCPNVIFINTFRKIGPCPRRDVPLDTAYSRYPTPRYGYNIGVLSVHPVQHHGDIFSFPTPSLLMSRAKLEEAFSKCIENGADIIVTPMFGAEGCDNNPTESVAEVLVSVITEFAGRVRRIVVASNIEEHTFRTIAARILGSRRVFGFDRESQSVDDVSGHFTEYARYPHEIVPRDINKTVCKYGGTCGHLDPQHFENFIHPPLCIDVHCSSQSNKYHMALFWHIKECRYGFGCRVTSKYHTHFYSHTNFRSHSISPLPSSSTKSKCRYGYDCTEIFSGKHANEFSHPFLPLCPNIMTCTNTDSAHTSNYCHICKWGTSCKDKPKHRQEAIHLNVCMNGDACNDLTDKHRDAFIHPGSPFPRTPCKNGIMCTDESLKHRKEYSHYRINVLKWESKMLNVHDPTAEKYQKDKPYYFVDFNKNVAQWEIKTDKYFISVGGLDERSANFRAVEGWISFQLPNHMCSGAVFLSMIRSGSISSLEHLRSIWENPKFFCANAASLPHIAPHIAKIKSSRDLLMKYIKKYVMKYQFELKTKNATAIAAMDKNSTQYKVLLETPPVTVEKEKKMIEERSNMLFVDSDNDIMEVEKAYKELVDHVYNLMTNITGCQNSNDINERTNYTPFSVIGPHNYGYGGSEVVLVLSREVMFHPDFYICPSAALLYGFGKSRSYQIGGKYPLNRTAWMGDNVPWPQHEKDYYEERFSPVAERWSFAAAKELIARASVTLNKSPKDVTLDDVKEYWNGSDTHHVFEGHLPYNVPLDYIRHIIITKPVYDAIYGNPFGKSAFDAWKAEHGDSFFSIVPGPEDVKKTSGTWPAEHPSPVIDKPSGFCFVLDQKSRETFVPIRLDEDKDNTYFSFMAKGGDFFFTLSSTPDFMVGGEVRSVMTFHISKDAMGLSVSFHPPLTAKVKPLKTDNDSYAARFNENCQQMPFIYYEVSLNYRRRTVAVYHYGPSRAYNSCMFIAPMMSTASRYSYISFCRTSEVVDSELPVIWNLRENFGPTPKETNACNLHTDVVINAKISSDDIPKVEIPVCDKPFTCHIYLNDEHPEHVSHCSSFKHVCLKGRKCKDSRYSSHRATRLHMDKPACPSANCTFLNDPAHRVGYSHRHIGLNDYLIPCKYGSACRDINNPGHCKKYYHDPSFVYPDIKNFKFLDN